jgi:archaellum component FlaC
MIHVPKKTSTTTLGEVGASVDMLRAQVTELSKRMDAMEYSFSEFKNSVANDVFLLKSTISEHATELLHVRDCVEDAHVHAKKTKELIEQQDICVDNLAHAVRQSNRLQHQKKIIASNVDLGIVRRRLSKVEDFTNEFYQQFESFKSVKDIISGLSDHINECDRDISSFIVKRNENLEVNDCNTDYSNECDQNILLTCIKNDQEEDDDFEKLY